MRKRGAPGPKAMEPIEKLAAEGIRSEGTRVCRSGGICKEGVLSRLEKVR